MNVVYAHVLGLQERGHEHNPSFKLQNHAPKEVPVSNGQHGRASGVSGVKEDTVIRLVMSFVDGGTAYVLISPPCLDVIDANSAVGGILKDKENEDGRDGYSSI